MLSFALILLINHNNKITYFRGNNKTKLENLNIASAFINFKQQSVKLYNALTIFILQ